MKGEYGNCLISGIELVGNVYINDFPFHNRD